MLGRRLVSLVDLERRGGEGLRGVAHLGALVATLLAFGRLRLGIGQPFHQPRAVERRRRRLFGIGDVEPMRGIAGRLEIVGHDQGHDLPGVVDAVGGERGDGRAHVPLIGGGLARLDPVADVAERQNLEHAGHASCRRLVDPGDAAARDRAGSQIAVGRLAAPVDVGAVTGLAGDLQPGIDARRGGADRRLDGVLGRERHGLGGAGDRHQTCMLPTCISARTSVRWPSSTL